MKLMEEVFFSFTMGGETLSLAAADAALTKLKREPVVATLRRHRPERILDGVRERITKHGIGDFARTSGHPGWTFLQFADTPSYSQWEIKTLFMQEMLARGILTLGTHNVTYAHTDADVDRAVPASMTRSSRSCAKRWMRAP